MSNSLFQDQEFSSKLAKAPTDKVSANLKGYTDTFIKESASLKTKLGVKELDLTQILRAGEKYREAMVNMSMKPLTLEAEALAGRIESAEEGSNARLGMELRLGMLQNDITFMKESLGQTVTRTWGESIGQPGVAPNMATVLPLQYINHIQNSFVKLVKTEVATKRMWPRQRVRNQVQVTGSDKIYYLPECLEDKSFLDLVLSAENRKKVVSVDTVAKPSTAVFNILAEFGADLVKGKDTLAPVAKLKYIVVDKAVVGTAENVKITLDDTVAAMTNPLRRNMLSILVTEKTSKKEFHIQMDFNFDEAIMRYLHTPGVLEIGFEAALAGGNFTRTITGMKSVREDFTVDIDEVISGTYSYNPMEALDKMTLENINTTVTAAEIMNTVLQAAKDRYGFKEMDTLWDQLTAATEVSRYNHKFHAQIDFDPDPTKTNVRPSSIYTFRTETLDEGLSEMMLDFDLKLKPATGFVTSMWTSKQNGRLFGEMVKVIGAGEVYGGVTSGADIKCGTIQGRAFKLLETQREDADSATIKAAPFSNDANEETFTMLQWETRMINDNSIRDIKNITMPSIHIIDNFKLHATHNIQGRLNLTNKDKISRVTKVV